jgi:histidyl-tRNA synthetase
MYKAPRGTQDILPSEQPYWSFVHRKIEEICQLYGYQRLETPMFEEAGLFQRSIGEETDIVAKEMYTFEDHGGDPMTLRPEGTAPVCRAYIEHGMHNLPQPVRLYYLADIFRYERPQAGRYRQHHQFGCEAIGDGEAALDAESIELAWNFLTSTGLKGLTLQLNTIGCQNCRPSYVQNLREYYSQYIHRLCPNCKTRLERNVLRLLDCKNDSCMDIAQGAPSITTQLCKQCDDHFFEVNPLLVRGLDYYTKTVFEILPPEEGSQSALGGGGRYDLLIEQLGGEPTPAIGFAVGLERTILNLRKQAIEIAHFAEPERPRAYVAFVDEEGRGQAPNIASSLRQAGIATTMATGARKLKTQLRHANVSGATHVVIAGGEELVRGNVVLRDMARSEQEEIPQQEVVERLKRLLP